MYCQAKATAVIQQIKGLMIKKKTMTQKVHKNELNIVPRLIN